MEKYREQSEEDARRDFETVGENFIQALSGDDYGILEEPDEEKWRAELTRRAQVRSAEFANQHDLEIQKLDISKLRKTSVGESLPLSPPEIRFLERVRGRTADLSGMPGYFTAEHNMDYDAVMVRLFSSGYLIFGSLADRVFLSDMQTLRKMAKDNGLKAGGKKAEIAQRIVDNCSYGELEKYNLSERYVLTEQGQRVLDENSALIRYYLTFSDGWTMPEKIIEEQKACPDASAEEILIRMLEEKLARAKKHSVRLPILHNLYKLVDDEQRLERLAQEIEKETVAADEEFKAHQAETDKLIAERCGMSADELQELRKEARREVL